VCIFRWQTISRLRLNRVSFTYNSRFLKTKHMTHSRSLDMESAVVWHFQPRVVIVPCPTHYRASSVKCLIAAFAELQTEVTDFTSDLSVVGIPVWDYPTYATLVLFPTVGISQLLPNCNVGYSELWRSRNASDFFQSNVAIVQLRIPCVYYILVLHTF